MAKKDISKILTTGSLKQKLLLVAEDVARTKYSKEKLLTDTEFNQISESFKKPNEIKLWNQWLKMDRIVTNSIINLQGLKFEVLMHFSNLRGYILLWETIQEAEVLSNHILHEIKDQEERIRISTQSAKLGKFIFTDIDIDEEGYLDMNIEEREQYETRKDKRYSLWEVMNNVKKEATTAVIQFISWRDAIIDYMEEGGFNVKTYKDLLKQMEEDVYKPIIGWRKYDSEEETFIPDMPNKRADKLKNKYSLTPNMKELKADPEIYNYFKTGFLRDE